MKLDELDKLILSALDFGPRIGLKHLADQLDRSQQVIDYRLRALQKRGVVTGFYPVVNAFRLGFRYCRLLVQLTDLSSTQTRSIKLFAQKHPAVLWCYRMEGDFNLVLVFWTKSLEEFETLSSKFLGLVGANVIAFNQSQVFSLEHFRLAQILLSMPHAPLSICESDEIAEVDALDSDIIRALSVDSRVPFSQLAVRCKTSDKVIAYRINRLEERGIVYGYRPLLHWTTVGLLYFKLFIRVDHSKEGIIDRLHTYLSNAPELLYVVRGVGSPGDIDLEVVVSGYPQLFDFIERLRKKFPGAIRSTSHYHFTECYKVNYFPLSS